MSPFRRHSLPFLVLLILVCLTATALAADRAPAQPTTGFTPRYSVVAEMELELMLEWGSSAVVDPAGGRIYALGYYNTQFSVIDTQPALQETSYALPFRVARLSLSVDGRRLYALEEPADGAHSGRIAVYNTATLAQVDTFTFVCPEEVWWTCAAEAAVAGPDNRLYVVLTGGTNIDIHDGTTGERLLRFAHPGGSLGGLAIHGTKLYTLAGTFFSETTLLQRFDISGLTPVVESTRELAKGAYGNLQVAPDGSFLITSQGNKNGATIQLDAESLGTIRTYQATGEHVYHRHVIISSNSDEIVLLWGYPPDGVKHIIEAHDATTGALLRVGFAQSNPDYYFQSGFVPLPNNRIAHLFPNWIKVLRPDDYAVTTPVVMSGFCAGPFVDTFSDPTSGWPVVDLGPVAYRYDRDQYSILQREDNRWSAVSRGDVWDNWQGAGIRTWVPSGEGMSGLVFGLNDDWSHFYTLEVIPHLRRWVIFEYSAAAGWQLRATGVGINGVDQSNSLVLNQGEDGALGLLVNDSLVYSLPSPPAGRIGLSGGSFENEQEIDLRFDDYMLVTGPNCFHHDTRANVVERSPVLSRPPLEEFLK